MPILEDGCGLQTALLPDCRGAACHSRLAQLTGQHFPCMLLFPIPWSKAIKHACRRRLRSSSFLCET